MCRGVGEEAGALFGHVELEALLCGLGCGDGPAERGGRCAEVIAGTVSCAMADHDVEIGEN